MELNLVDSWDYGSYFKKAFQEFNREVGDTWEMLASALAEYSKDRKYQ